MKTQSALINPVKLPDDLNEAERHFVQCMAAGKPCIFGETRPKPDDKNAPVLRADVIHFFAHGGSANHPLRGNLIHLQGAWVDGDLRLLFANIPYVLGFFGCHLPNTVRLTGAKCLGLYMDGSYLAEDLWADGIQIESNLSLQGCCAKGAIRIIGAKIGGNLYCNGGEFHGEHERSIFADRIQVGVHVLLNEGFSAENAVQLRGADIGGMLNCDGGSFNFSKYAIVADDVRVKDDVAMMDGFSAASGVYLPGAEIGGDLHCYKGNFNGGLDVERAKIKKSIVWREVRGGGIVNLAFASVNALEDDESRQKFKFYLDKCSYARFGDADISSRIAWLDNRPDGAIFSSQPFEQAAAVLFDMGDSNGAREVLLEKERRITVQGGLPTLQKIGRKYWDVLTGYGYKLHRAILLTAMIIVMGTGLFSYADHACQMVPHQTLIATKPEYVKQTVGKCTDDNRPTKVVERLYPAYPRFYAFAYSLDIFMPFFALHQEPNWYPQPQTRGIVGLTITGWYWAQIIYGWAITTLIALTISGALRPRQSSGKE